MPFKTRQVRAFTRNLDLDLYKVGGGIGKWYSFLIFFGISQINKNDQRVRSNYEWVASSNNNKVQNQNGIKNLDVTLIWSWIKHDKLTNYKKQLFYLYFTHYYMSYFDTKKRKWTISEKHSQSKYVFKHFFTSFYFSQKGLQILLF